MDEDPEMTTITTETTKMEVMVFLDKVWVIKTHSDTEAQTNSLLEEVKAEAEEDPEVKAETDLDLEVKAETDLDLEVKAEEDLEANRRQAKEKLVQEAENLRLAEEDRLLLSNNNPRI
jgi:hypothetical protein